MKLVDVLKRIKEDTVLSIGICGNYKRIAYEHELPDSLDEFDECMVAACEGWVYFSGNWMFPIAYEGLREADAYELRHKWTGEYGRRRMELLDRMIGIAEDM
ncbi:MAG: hypothetical protein Unbinned4336contig1000_13 [Prokaryotic dsDNA virus sp.]|nr:MAG: hypothetical protein Unbinned4336contig1000_13 [Prokaryotic dsDNA virus sp.]|tara:strand:- start:33121 stop:33426 length:306 start_codon:yes stop_codon:yes gene_type:complete